MFKIILILSIMNNILFFRRFINEQKSMLEFVNKYILKKY